MDSLELLLLRAAVMALAMPTERVRVGAGRTREARTTRESQAKEESSKAVTRGECRPRTSEEGFFV